MSDQTEQTDVKLEDLLKLKKYEQPDVAFWKEFDVKMRRKAFKAFVKKDPWYVRAARAAKMALKPVVAVPTAATAALALYVTPWNTATVVETAEPQPEVVQVAQAEPIGIPVEAVLAEQNATFVVDVITAEDSADFTTANTMKVYNIEEDVQYVAGDVFTGLPAAAPAHAGFF